MLGSRQKQSKIHLTQIVPPTSLRRQLSAGIKSFGFSRERIKAAMQNYRLQNAKVKSRIYDVVVGVGYGALMKGPSHVAKKRISAAKR